MECGSGNEGNEIEARRSEARIGEGTNENGQAKLFIITRDHNKQIPQLVLVLVLVPCNGH